MFSCCWAGLGLLSSQALAVVWIEHEDDIDNILMISFAEQGLVSPKDFWVPKLWQGGLGRTGPGLAHGIFSRADPGWPKGYSRPWNIIPSYKLRELAGDSTAGSCSGCWAAVPLLIYFSWSLFLSLLFKLLLVTPVLPYLILFQSLNCSYLSSSFISTFPFSSLPMGQPRWWSESSAWD